MPSAAEVIAARCSADNYDDPGKPAIAWDDAEARNQLVDALVSDAHRLLGYLPDEELGPRAAEAVALLALIAAKMWDRSTAPMAPTDAAVSPRRWRRIG